MTEPKSLALRRYLGIDDDPDCRHDFVFGAQIHPTSSDNVLTKLS
jgi:hypothetical protein